MTAPASVGAYYVTPLVIVGLIASPLLSLLVSGSIDALSVLVVSPVILGLIATPGYLRAVFATRTTASPRVPLWVVLSVGAMFVAASIGVGGGSMMVLFLPPSLLVAIQAVVLLRRTLSIEGYLLPIAGGAAALIAISTGVTWGLHCSAQFTGSYGAIPYPMCEPIRTIALSMVGALLIISSLAYAIHLRKQR